MSFGKSSGSSAPVVTDEQKQAIAAQTGLLTNVIVPSYQQAVTGATNVYNANAPGVLNAAQNLAGTAGQAQNVLGSTGESALRTGVSGLESLFTPEYERNQIMAALAPAQTQYLQNIANQQAGQLGSARQALAAQQLAGATQAAQMQTAAQLQSQIAAQRAAVANQLAGIGAGNIGQALGAAGQQVSAAMTPSQLYNQYASVLFGTPAASYTPDFRGTQGNVTTGTQFGIGGSYGSFNGAGKYF
jgi:hypothetical protein